MRGRGGGAAASAAAGRWVGQIYLCNQSPEQQLMLCRHLQLWIFSDNMGKRIRRYLKECEIHGLGDLNQTDNRLRGKYKEEKWTNCTERAEFPFAISAGAKSFVWPIVSLQLYLPATVVATICLSGGHESSPFIHTLLVSPPIILTQAHFNAQIL